MSGLIYKIVAADVWAAAKNEGVFAGAPVDLADGFIHFSDAAQVRETAARHFAGQAGLLLVAFEAAALSPLRWEASRGGALFPHLYAPLDPALAVSETKLPLGPGGAHVFPDGIP
jgi:uncharacterized protein (DUF952 family)